MTSPTARSYAVLRERGLPYQAAQYWNSFAKRHVDLFGFIDVVVLAPSGIVGLQVTDDTDHAKRRTKILSLPRATDWLRSGGLIWIWSWGLRGPRGERKKWALREEVITLEHFSVPTG